MFNLTFLGTSSGMPTKSRNVSGLAVAMGEQEGGSKKQPWILVDCGEGTQHQIMRAKLSLSKLQAVLITHVHGDHCYGLAGLLASLSMQNRKETLTIIAPKAIAKLLDAYSLTTELTFDFGVNFVAIEDILAEHGSYELNLSASLNLKIEIHELSHRCPSYAFAITQTQSQERLNTKLLTKMGISKSYWREIFNQKHLDTPISIQGISLVPSACVIGNKKSCKIVIAGDNDKPELLARAIKNTACLVHEATYTDEILQKVLAKSQTKNGYNPKHSSAKMVATFAQKKNIPLLILTHFSARFAPYDNPKDTKPNMGHIRVEAKTHFHNRLILATDFLEVQVP